MQTWIAQAETVARAIVTIMLVIGWVSLNSYEDQVARTSPRVPSSPTGETIPVQWKSVTVYMRPFDARVNQYMDYGGIVGALIVGFLIFRKWRKDSK
jgi:hypothetical protein